MPDGHELGISWCSGSQGTVQSLSEWTPARATLAGWQCAEMHEKGEFVQGMVPPW